MALNLSSLAILGVLTDGHAYVIEEYDATGFKRGMLLPYVQSVSLNRPNSVDFAWTLGEFPVIDHSGLRNANITLSGRSGVSNRLGQSASGGPKYASGPDLFRELSDFLNNFHKKVTKEDNFLPLDAENKSRLAIRALFEERVFWVDVENFNWQRNAMSSRFSYEWSLSLKIYGDANKPSLYDVFSKVRKFGAVATGLINTWSGYIAFANQATKTATSAFQSLTHGPLLAVRGFVDEVGELGASAGVLSSVPFSMMGIVLDIAERSLVVGRQIYLSFPYGSRHDDAFRKYYYDAAANLGLLRRSIYTSAGMLLKRIEEAGDPDTPTENSEFVAPLDKKKSPDIVFGQYVPYTSKEGDTIPSISIRLFGTPSYVKEILEVNEMANMWQMPDGSPFKPGSIILVPSQDEGISPYLIKTMADIYGADFLLSDEGDFVLDGVGGEDFLLVRGPSLLEQALTVRIKTEQGDHGVFPNYGLPKMIGDGNTLESAGTLLSRTRQQLLDDPRIKKVSSLTIVDGGDTFSVECVLDAVGGQSVNANVPIGV